MDGGILSKFFGTNVPVIPDIKLDDLADLPDKPVQEEKKGQNIPGSKFLLVSLIKNFAQVSVKVINVCCCFST